jgi:hypothetical protein
MNDAELLRRVVLAEQPERSPTAPGDWAPMETVV